MGTPWTPGKWHVTDGWDEGSPALLIKRGNSEIVALLPNYDDSNATANARLIAEAPAMAEALEHIEQLIDYGQYAAAQRIIEAILARIKGESP